MGENKDCINPKIFLRHLIFLYRGIERQNIDTKKQRDSSKLTGRRIDARSSF